MAADVLTCTFRVLWLTVTVVAESQTVLDAVGVIAGPNDQEVPGIAAVAFEVRGWPTEVEVLENGDHLATASSLDEVVAVVYERVHRRVAEISSRSGWVRLHAATVDVDGRRTLLVGDSGMGKTSTALCLALVGARVEGDECALIRGGRSVALPRQLHVKAGSRTFVPEISCWQRDDDPELPGGIGRMLDPGRLERWRITDRPVGRLVLLGGFGDERVEEVSGDLVLRALASQVLRFLEPRPVIVTELAGLLRACTAVRITAPSSQRTAGLILARD